MALDPRLVILAALALAALAYFVIRDRRERRHVARVMEPILASLRASAAMAMAAPAPAPAPRPKAVTAAGSQKIPDREAVADLALAPAMRARAAQPGPRLGATDAFDALPTLVAGVGEATNVDSFAPTREPTDEFRLEAFFRDSVREV